MAFIVLVLLGATIPLRHAFYNAKSEAEAQRFYDINRASFLTGVVLAGGAGVFWGF